MSIRKILCLIMAAALCAVSAMAETDVQAQLDEANARIAELEAEVELYKPYYEKSIAVEYDGGVITVDEAMEIYDYYNSLYSQYGIDLASYGYDSYYKQVACEESMTEKAAALKAAELGLDVTEEQEAELRAQAAENMESYVDSYISYVYGDDTEVTDEQREEARTTLETQYGYSEDALYEDLKTNAISENVYNYAIQDVTVSDEDVQATYDSLVAADEESYADESSYVSAVTSDTTILWNPEGYRMIKQVLIKFDDDQTARYDELSSKLSDLNAEMEAAAAPAEEAAEETAEEAAEETAEEATDETAEEETEPARSAEEIQADIDETQTELDALYAEIQPRVQEVVDAFNAGTSFDELVAQYNDDTGMPEAGYPVKAESVMWDTAFSDAAMAIPEIGQIGEPANGMYGTYITYYAADVTPGAVALDDVRDYVTEQSLSDKQTTVYNDTITSWVAEFNPVYHVENMD